MTYAADKRLTRDEVIAKLRALATDSDFEVAHDKADTLLCELIDDAEIIAAYNAVGKWYA